MTDFSQGDLIRIAGFKNFFLIVSKNSFIKATGVFHVCPVLSGISEGPLHISIKGRKQNNGIALCEQVKLIDPSARGCTRIDSVPYDIIMNISDALQGIFEYD